MSMTFPRQNIYSLKAFTTLHVRQEKQKSRKATWLNMNRAIVTVSNARAGIPRPAETPFFQSGLIARAFQATQSAAYR